MQYQTEYRRHLPHIIPKDGIFHVVFRVKGSISGEKITKFQNSFQEQKLNIQAASKQEYNQVLKQLNWEYFEQIETELHTSSITPLKDLKKAKIVQNALLHFHKTRYDVLAYSIMPNHVHMVIMNLKQHLSLMLKVIKGFSAREINKLDGKRGSFWQDETYDHLIKSRNELADTVEYILNNPVKSGLCENWQEHEFTWCDDWL